MERFSISYLTPLRKRPSRVVSCTLLIAVVTAAAIVVLRVAQWSYLSELGLSHGMIPLLALDSIEPAGRIFIISLAATFMLLLLFDAAPKKWAGRFLRFMYHSFFVLAGLLMILSALVLVLMFISCEIAWQGLLVGLMIYAVFLGILLLLWNYGRCSMDETLEGSKFLKKGAILDSLANGKMRALYMLLGAVFVVGLYVSFTFPLALWGDRQLVETSDNCSTEVAVMFFSDRVILAEVEMKEGDAAKAVLTGSSRVVFLPNDNLIFLPERVSISRSEADVHY